MKNFYVILDYVWSHWYIFWHLGKQRKISSSQKTEKGPMLQINKFKN